MYMLCLRLFLFCSCGALWSMGDDTEALQQAIDNASCTGGVVRVERGVYHIRQLSLKSNVTLQLDAGAILKGSTNQSDYVLSRFKGLISSVGQTNVAIQGEGVIDGQGRALVWSIAVGTGLDKKFDNPQAWFLSPPRHPRPSENERPHLVTFKECRNIRVSGVTLTGGASWVNTYYNCQNVLIEHLKIESRAFWNNDGIDICDSKDVVIRHCEFDTADDAICLKSHQSGGGIENVLIHSCKIRSSASAIKIGTPTYGLIKNIRINDVQVRDTFRSVIAIESVDGSTVDGVEITRVTGRNVGNPLFIRLGARTGTGGAIRNIRIEQMDVEVSKGKPDMGLPIEAPPSAHNKDTLPIVISGIPGKKIENILLQNCRFVFPGGCVSTHKREVQEALANYPEFDMFGDLPSWGLYARHSTGLTLKNITFDTVLPDRRQKIWQDDN